MTISIKALVTGLIIGLVIGGASSWFVKPKEIERVTETVPGPTVTETVTATPIPSGARYLTKDGNETKILLLGSKLRYGIYPHDVPGTDLKAGDPCVIVTVTIRNDYTENAEEWPHGYGVAFGVKLYDNEGKEVGHIVMPDRFPTCVAEVFVRPGGVAMKDIYLVYDKRDIIRYEVYIWSISPLPIP